MYPSSSPTCKSDYPPAKTLNYVSITRAKRDRDSSPILPDSGDRHEMTVPQNQNTHIHYPLHEEEEILSDNLQPTTYRPQPKKLVFINPLIDFTIKSEKHYEKGAVEVDSHILDTSQNFSYGKKYSTMASIDNNPYQLTFTDSQTDSQTDSPVDSPTMDSHFPKSFSMMEMDPYYDPSPSVDQQFESLQNPSQIHSTEKSISAPNSSPNREWEILNPLNEGSSGIVYKAIDKHTQNIYAIKSSKKPFFTSGITKSSIRELKFQQELDSISQFHKVPDTLLRTNEFFLSPSNTVSMVMDYYPSDLKHWLSTQNSGNFNPPLIRSIMREIFTILDFFHSHWIIHRDIKLNNILFNPDTLKLKFTDFGLTRKFGYPTQPMTPNVSTLWYRAPELLIGETEYDSSIDMWSAAICFTGILNKGAPIFQELSPNDQLSQILSNFGIPKTKTTFSRNLAKFLDDYPFRFPLIKNPPTLAQRYPSLDHNALDLLTLLFQVDPGKRITPADALKHPYFIDI